MGLDIFFLDDIRNAIMAADEASSATAEAAATNQDARTLDLISRKLREELPEGKSRVLLDALHAAAVGNIDALKHYRRGYRAALVTLTLAFGLGHLSELQQQAQRRLITNGRTLPEKRKSV